LVLNITDIVLSVQAANIIGKSENLRMATSEATRTRAPRGAKAVVSAFMAALDDIPDARRAEVAKAAQLVIRDEVKMLAAKAKDASRKSAARKPVKPATSRKLAAKKAVAPAPAAAPTPPRRAKRAPAADVAA
jgi:hypothetical protein